MIQEPAIRLRVHRIGFYRTDMLTRFPFRYGIASMSRLPHLFVRAEVEIDGRPWSGVAADGLPPKWFTKDATTRYEEDDLPAMLRVIRHAADLAVDLGYQPNPFLWWWELYRAQAAWAREEGVPTLLAGFGTSLMERAVIDAACRSRQITLFDALHRNAFGIHLGTLRHELGACQPADILPMHPREQVLVRHTIGLGDPITDGDVDRDQRIDDGLPHSLVSNIREYGLSYFKVKLGGDKQQDCERLSQLANVFSAEIGSALRFTLDGNEQYDDITAFRDCWERFRSIKRVQEMIDRSLLFVEQPLHRRTALNAAVKEDLRKWPQAPQMIIDESDADLDSLPRALELGYAGTSHKNCKGIFKSVAAAATISQCCSPAMPLILSAEDLVNVGPVALLQDLAVVSALGIGHVERNGHHYFAGLSMFPQSIQQRLVADHGDLYRWHDRGFATLAPESGRLVLGSINRAPFGLAHPPELSLFPSWDF